MSVDGSLYQQCPHSGSHVHLISVGVHHDLWVMAGNSRQYMPDMSVPWFRGRVLQVPADVFEGCRLWWVISGSASPVSAGTGYFVSEAHLP